MARLLARALLCSDLQDGEPCNKCDNCEASLSQTSAAILELDAASQGTIDHIREIVDELPFVVPGARKRIYIFDEAQRMSAGAQDVLLKPIEDKKLVAIFCTTEVEKIRGPIRSRCEGHQIRKVEREEILARMKMILEREGVESEDDAVLTVIDASGGHVRDILNRLEMVAQLGPVTLAAVRERLNLSIVTVYFEILLALGDTATAIKLVEQACDRVGPDEVNAGLAEAAMNAFRLANNMHVDFTLVDRNLAAQVHQKFGNQALPQLASFFLQSFRSTKIGLICDIARCAQGVPTASAPTTTPPVVVAMPQPATPVAVQPQATPVPTPAPPRVETPPAPPAPSAAPTASAPQPTASAGIEPLTDLDSKIAGREMPRGAERNPAASYQFKNSEGHGKSPERKIIPSSQWRQEFEEAFFKSGQQ